MSGSPVSEFRMLGDIEWMISTVKEYVLSMNICGRISYKGIAKKIRSQHPISPLHDSNLKYLNT
jgi:hypothetical protein